MRSSVAFGASPVHLCLVGKLQSLGFCLRKWDHATTNVRLEEAPIGSNENAVDALSFCTSIPSRMRKVKLVVGNCGCLECYRAQDSLSSCEVLERNTQDRLGASPRLFMALLLLVEISQS